VLILAASVLYAIGVFGVTVLGNVPLNKTLGIFSIQTASAGEVAQQRLAFEQPWNMLNFIRTIASILTLVLVIVACLTSSAASGQE
jgi:uncharacterized membrane protein